MFADRSDAGRRLAARLYDLRGDDDLLVLALPRGGVPVAYEIARELRAPLDVLVVRKLGVPFQPELAMGAIASGGAIHLNDEVVRLAGVDGVQLTTVIQRERAELERREAAYRGQRPPPQMQGRTVIVVDDGIATGASMLAALAALRPLKPAALICAVPVAPPEAAARLAGAADRFVCLLTPPDFSAVGQFYARFEQTTDAEVRTLLERASPAAR